MTAANERSTRLRASLPPLVAALAALVASSAPARAAATEASRLEVSQARALESADTRIKAFLDILDADGRPVSGLAEGQLSATLGSEQLRLERLRPLASTDEGVAYVFLVDVSRSILRQEFAAIRNEIRAWIEDLAPRDRAALVAFGDESRLVVDFTSRRGELLSALDRLGPTDDQTLLHRALLDALALCRRRDPTLPDRRVIVVLTDGRDEGSGLDADDVLAQLRLEAAPVYAIGHSRLRDPQTRRRYLDLLHRFATNSGGSFHEAARTDFADAYAAIRRSVRGVWLAELACPTCVRDGREYRFQATLAVNGRALTDGVMLRLLPPLAGARSAPSTSPAAAEPPPAAAAPPRGEPATGAPPAGEVPEAADRPAPTEPEAGVDGGAGEGSRRRQIWPWVVALVAAAGLAALWVFRLPILDRLERLLPPEEAEEPGMEAENLAPLDPELEPPPIPRPAGSASQAPRTGQEAAAASLVAAAARRSAPDPSPPSAAPKSREPRPCSLRLIVVRGSRAGRQYRITFQERALVGARSDCDCVLADEPGVDPEQFELYEHSGRIYIRNLGVTHPTLLEGLPLRPRQSLESEQLLGTGELILRVVLDQEAS